MMGYVVDLTVAWHEIFNVDTKCINTFTLSSGEDAVDPASSRVSSHFLNVLIPSLDSVLQADAVSMSGGKLLTYMTTTMSWYYMSPFVQYRKLPLQVYTWHIDDWNASPSFYTLLEFYEWTQTVPSVEGSETDYQKKVNRCCRRIIWLIEHLTPVWNHTDVLVDIGPIVYSILSCHNTTSGSTMQCARRNMHRPWYDAWAAWDKTWYTVIRTYRPCPITPYRGLVELFHLTTCVAKYVWTY